MRTAAGWLYAMAGLVGLAGITVGAVLMTHSAQTCDTQLFCTTGHPFVGAGAGVLIGALINAAVLAVVAHLCEVVADLRDRRHAATAAPTEGAAAASYVPGEPSTLYGTKG